MKSQLLKLSLFCGGALALASSANAHLVTSGLGPFYDGVTHLALSPAELLGVVAIGLLAGSCGKSAGRALLWALPASWLVGGLLGLQLKSFSFQELGLGSLVLCLGALVAWGRKWSPKIIVLFCAAFGLFTGSSQATALTGTSNPFTALAGNLAFAFVATAILAALVSTLEKQWTQVAVRVAGSWIAAASLLIVGWSLRI